MVSRMIASTTDMIITEKGGQKRENKAPMRLPTPYIIATHQNHTHAPHYALSMSTDKHTLLQTPLTPALLIIRPYCGNLLDTSSLFYFIYLLSSLSLSSVFLLYNLSVH